MNAMFSLQTLDECEQNALAYTQDKFCQVSNGVNLFYKLGSVL
jgi:hypothetical protein